MWSFCFSTHRKMNLKAPNGILAVISVIFGFVSIGLFFENRTLQQQVVTISDTAIQSNEARTKHIAMLARDNEIWEELDNKIAAVVKEASMGGDLEVLQLGEKIAVLGLEAVEKRLAYDPETGKDRSAPE